MSTISFGVVVDNTEKRHRRRMVETTGVLPDVEYSSQATRQLSKGQSFTIAPKRLFVCSTNGTKILIRLTVDGVTIVLPVTQSILLPFVATSVVSIIVENPSDNDTDIPAAVSYLTV